MKSRSLALALPLVLAAFGCDTKTTETTSAIAAPMVSAIPVTAVELHKAYKTNEVAADEKFKGKAVRVTGKLIGISKDFSDAIYLTIHPGTAMGELEALHAYFDDNQKAAIAALKPGQVIIFDGRVDGFMMGSVMLKECVIAK
jgi:hypothetical protein